jgi:drug/metabolite transporter (DMT)-like permease
MTSEPASLRSRARGLLDRPYLILTLTVAFWGGNAVAGKAAVGNIDPYALTILRWGGAFLAILPFAVPVLAADWPKIARKWWLYLIYGGIGYAAFNVFLYVAAYFTSGINIALDQVGINILVMLGNFAFYRTRVRALQLVGVALTILGVAATATHGDLSRLLALNLNFGDLLVLLACVGYAAYSLLLRYRPATDWKSFVCVSFLIAFLTSLVLQAALGGGLPSLLAAVPHITPTGWFIALYTMLFPSLISQMLYVRGVELIGPNRASLFINLIPLFGALGAVVILGEALQPFHLIAGALIVVGIVLAEWSAQR